MSCALMFDCPWYGLSEYSEAEQEGRHLLPLTWVHSQPYIPLHSQTQMSKTCSCSISLKLWSCTSEEKTTLCKMLCNYCISMEQIQNRENPLGIVQHIFICPVSSCLICASSNSLHSDNVTGKYLWNICGSCWPLSHNSHRRGSIMLVRWIHFGAEKKMFLQFSCVQ